MNKQFDEMSSVFQDHVGFMLYDPVTEKEVYSYHPHQYFTPASNVKILTLYTSMVVLGDSIPALRYRRLGDSLIFEGTGDPSFLYNRVYSDRKVYDFLRDTPAELYFYPWNFQAEFFGPGWAWDDYNYSYSVERSPFPVYGNRFTVYKQQGSTTLTTRQPFFKRFIWMGDSILQDRASMRRAVNSMQTSYYPARALDSAGWQIPFRTDPLLVANILADTLKRPVRITHTSPGTQSLTLHSIPADSLYRVMMQESDNFIAEQLLMMCAGVLGDTLNPSIAIRYMQENYLNDLDDKVMWVDGSGLSRYNLVTPASIVALWEKLYHRIPSTQLFHLLAIGGESGTIKNYYHSDAPYVFGKTGTLSNNHALSGYLITRSGRVLIFSFMNSNYVAPVGEVRTYMESILRQIRDKYKDR